MREKNEKNEIKSGDRGKVKLKVSKVNYAVARTRNFDVLNHLNFPFFALINDGREITVVAEEEKLPEGLEAERGFRLITFETVLPFDMVGFIARISRVLAEKNVPILVFSSYSTDHILVRTEYLQKAVEALYELGFD
ncbi:ACT domain-containing protein [Archaeoglobales archaeon]|nr:MAG: ACT domain-containing protein [Archaeoglobales archaeon]